MNGYWKPASEIYCAYPKAAVEPPFATQSGVSTRPSSHWSLPIFLTLILTRGRVLNLVTCVNSDLNTIVAFSLTSIAFYKTHVAYVYTSSDHNHETLSVHEFSLFLKPNT